VVAMDDTGLPTGEAQPSLEYQQLIERGLEIMEVRIHNVLFDPSIEEQTIKNWNAEWTKIAKREEDLLNEREKLIETAARNEAVKRFARLASQKFENPTLNILRHEVRESNLHAAGYLFHPANFDRTRQRDYSDRRACKQPNGSRSKETGRDLEVAIGQQAGYFKISR